MKSEQKNEDSKKPTGLSLLRVPFPENQISKLPKPTKKQTEEVRTDFKKGIRCKICGGWHHKDVIHLDYVGHAALTDRLLDADDHWNWEPLSFTQEGLPATDKNGGMWIRLTVCGVTRLGYGHSDGKQGGDAVKEVIGDALRNAAMRFGAALDLWHKGSLHDDEEVTSDADTKSKAKNGQKDEDAAYEAPKKHGDLTDFAKQYAQDIGMIETSEELDMLVRKNVLDLGTLASALPKWHARIIELLDQKRQLLDMPGAEGQEVLPPEDIPHDDAGDR